MSEVIPPVDSLVLYKQRPARVTESGPKKIAIQTEGGALRVRPKDVMLLHPGPLGGLSGLRAPEGEVMAAWELLAGETIPLSELAELAYDDFTPATAWAIWEMVADGLYFRGSSPDAIRVQTAEDVAEEEAARTAKTAQEEARNAFLQRIRQGTYMPEDEARLGDVVALALKRRQNSRTMRTLERSETPEDAHALLLHIGYWDEFVNPYPARFDIDMEQPDAPLPALPGEDRLDLTHLPAFAIDDEGNQDPDDAISLEVQDDRRRLWVHVADVAALVSPDSPVDLEARDRGANLYLPEGTVHMLPVAATEVLGLGLAEISPALSFGIDIDEEGAIGEVEVAPSWVRVTRLNYQEADAQMDASPLRELGDLLARRTTWRQTNGAVELSFPEVKVQIEDGRVILKPIERTRSRLLVQEAMLTAGAAAARFAMEHDIPVPFTVQLPPNVEDAAELQGETLADMFAIRKRLNPGRQVAEPGPHAGLGLDAYIQVTSPLRRYHDLLAHQQLRAFLKGEPPLDADAVMERTAAAREAVRNIRRAERLSITHWRMVYLLQHPGWLGEGIVVDQRGARNRVILPDLALETQVSGNRNLALDDAVKLALTSVDLPMLDARFRYV